MPKQEKSNQTVNGTEIAMRQKAMSDFHIQTFDMLKNICDFIEEHTDLHISTQIYCTEESPYGFYRIYFSHDNYNWSYVDGIPLMPVEKVFQIFQRSVVNHQYTSCELPFAESMNNLHN